MLKGRAEINGTSLAYQVSGRGAPLVLISGGGTLDQRGWDDQFAVFARGYRVVRYDIRGIGASWRPTAPFSHSHDLRALLEFLRIGRAHLLGLSVGGAIALDFAIEYPEMVDRLVLAASGTSSDALGEANLNALAALSALVKRDGLPEAIRLIVGTQSFLATGSAVARERVRQIYADNADVFESDFPFVRLWQPVQPAARGRLSEVLAPVLVLEGGQDAGANRDIARDLLGITGAAHAVIDGAGHAIQLDKPDEFNAAVLTFLAERPES